MSNNFLGLKERRRIDALVDCYVQHQPKLRLFLNQLLPLLTDAGSPVAAYVHSYKARLKEPSHLRGKLERKFRDTMERGEVFDITQDNLFVRINDLVGVRLLHLHTRQMAGIHKAVAEALAEGKIAIKEGPFARTWDDESKELFATLGIETRQSGPSLYTSVHYVVDSYSKTTYTAEIQIRTLAEELWGEVAHTIDYPTPCPDVACKEQIRVLARVTSSCSRLVDAIFKSHEEYIARKSASKNTPKRPRQTSRRA